MDDALLALERGVQQLGWESDSLDIGEDTLEECSVYSQDECSVYLQDDHSVYSDNVTSLDLYAPATSLAKPPKGGGCRRGSFVNSGPNSPFMPNFCTEYVS